MKRVSINHADRPGVPGWRSGVAVVLSAAAVAGLVSLCAPALASPAFDYVFVVTSDYSVSGQVSTIDVMPPWSVDQNLASVHSDAVAREYEGSIYVVNRLYQDNIQVIDPAQGFATIRQFSVGPGSNPQDIAFVSPTRAYVSRYEEATLYEVDPTTGAVTDVIDLSALADADGIPEMAQMAVSGDRLFVAVQRLDRDYYWLPIPPSYLAVIDTGTNELVDVDPVSPGTQGIALAATNPSTEILQDPDTGVLYVGEAGEWGPLDGAIEAVDPEALTSLGLVSTEAQLGGEINDFALPVCGTAHAVLSVSDPSWEAFCVSFDWATGDKIQEVWRPGGFSVTDIEVHDGARELFLCDRTYANPGVRVFDAIDGQQLTPGPLDVGLPPHDLLVVGDEVVGVQEGHEPHGRALALSVSPNPCRLSTAVEFAVPAAGRCRVAVYDASGRLVEEISDATREAGRWRVAWDGTARGGGRVASGVYFVRLTSGGGSRTAKLIVVR
jgi:hypothetical protein